MEVPIDIKLIYINKNIAYLSELTEDDISLIYDKIREIVPPEPKLKKTLNKIVPHDIKKVRKTMGNVKVIESKKNTSNKIPKPIDDDDDSDSNSNDDDDIDPLIEEKNTLILKYVNGLLRNAGKNEIDDLTEFKNIDRIDIISDVNVKYLGTMAKELFKLFDRNKCRYYPKTAKSRPLNVLRGMIKDTGTYNLVGYNTEISEIINGRRVRLPAMLYSIR
jgi:hypothetical protein